MSRSAEYVVNLIVRRWWVVVGVAVLSAFVLVLFLGKDQDIWFDESYSIILAKHNPIDIIKLTGVDAHPPLYYLLLKVWGSVFGWSELALRTLSAFLSAATVGVIALMLRQLFTIRVAIVSLPFLVFAPFWLRYGYEIRMYALAGLITALGSWVLVQAVKLKADRRWWALYAVLVAAGMYTLYMTIVVWLAHFAWLAFHNRGKFWRQPWFLSFVGAGLLFVPYISTFIYQLQNSALPINVSHVLDLTHIGELLSMLLIYTPEWSVGKWSAVGILLTLGLMLYLLDRIRHTLSPQGRRSLGFVFTLAVFPLGFFVLASLIKPEPFFLPRYLVQAILYAYALIGVTIALGWRKGYRQAAGALCVLSLVLLGWGMGQLVHAGNFNYERMQRPQTAKVRQLVDCKNSVIVADDAYTYMNDLYYFDGCDMRFYSPDPLPYWGGYAWLWDSKVRVSGPADVNAKTLVYLYWKMGPKNFKPDSRYRLVSTVTYDFQSTDTYERITN
jgi:mannosyltransferase